MRDDDENSEKNNPFPSPNGHDRENPGDMKLWGVFIFGLIGATATTFALGGTKWGLIIVASTVLLVSISLKEAA